MASSSNADNSKEVQLYPYPTHVNTANFVSIKLSGKTNYRSWQEQMMCLLDSHDMLGFIDGTTKCNQGIKGDSKRTHNKEYREWKRSDTLIKGWIFGSLTEDVMDRVVGLKTSQHVWKQLKNNYDILVARSSNVVGNQDSSRKILAAPTSDAVSKQDSSTNILAASTTNIVSTQDSSTHISAAPTSNIVSNQALDSTKYRPLYEAIVNGHLEKASEYFVKDKDALIAKINDDHDSPLHVAIGTFQNIHFVEDLLKKINSESLPTLVCKRRQNPLHRAALVGNIKAAKMLVKKKPNLLFIPDKQRLLPIHTAIFGDHVNTFLYLLEVTKKHIGLSQEPGHDSPFKGLKAAGLLNKLIGNGLCDVAYELIKKYPDMARTKKDFSILLKSVAGKLDAYLSGTKYNFFQNFVYQNVPIKDHNLDNAREIDHDIENQVPDTTTHIAEGSRSCFYSVIRWIYVKLWEVLLQHVAHVKRLHEDKMKHDKTHLLLKYICKKLQEKEKEGEHREHYHEVVLFALENGTPETIEEIIKSFPQAISAKQDDLNLLQLSIVNRCENVYIFLVNKAITVKHEHRFLNDKDGNNILHLAGKLAPIQKLSMVSGAALKMQRELQWFEEVKKFVPPRHSLKKNKNQETPIMVFKREHKDLRKEGEEWMKKTADSYTITAALIITIVFAAAITVPGGNDDNGKSIYATNLGFIIFMVSDAISFFTSTTSLLLSLSILTTRYRDEDFLYRLPKRLILGLGMLFVSVTAMTIAFSATLYIMFAQGETWILFPIAALTCLPIISFATLQLPLLFDLISSTYGQGIFGKQSDGKIKLH